MDGLCKQFLARARFAQQQNRRRAFGHVPRLLHRAGHFFAAVNNIAKGARAFAARNMLGVDGFTPILNPPETGILGVGRVVEKPGVFEGQVCVRKMMTLSLTFNHMVAEEALDYLDAPIVRVGAPYCPVPFSPPLEKAYIPGADQIVAAVKSLR